MKIKAAVCYEYNTPLVVEEIDLDDEPREKEVLVKTISTGICGTDIGCMYDGMGGWDPLPMIFGHEGCGVIEKIGSGVTEFKVGDYVVSCQPHCGFCYECSQGRPWNCQNGGQLVHGGGHIDGVSPFSKDGKRINLFSGCSTFADHMVCNVNSLTKVPEGIPPEIAGPFGCGFITGVGTIIKDCKPQSNDSIVVLGVGGVGMAALMAAKAENCKTIIAVDIMDSRLELAKELGADYVINFKKSKNVVQEIIDLTDGGADIAVDVSGSQEAFKAGMAALRMNGHMALVSVTREAQFDQFMITFAGKTFSCISMGFTYPQYDTLNLRDVRVYDYKEDADGKKQRVLNKKHTMLAQQKQELIKQKFQDWIWQNPERRQILMRQYNDLFNSTRPRQYDGSHIIFPGLNPEIQLDGHQVNGVARNIYGGNTLYAHVVGAGKTFTMIATAQESKRLGLCQKSLIAVPNHLTEQWAAEYLRLYPAANILVATKKDFEMRNRKKFCAKIATGDYDAVIIGHSQLEKIPMSHERQERQIQEQIWAIEEGLLDLKSTNGERFSIKQLEKTKRSLMTRLTKLNEGKKRDDVVTFEQLGVDRLFVDEAHQFKNLFLYTKMRNVAGLSTSEAQKSSDLYMKCRYMDELTENRGIIFATGTPISNSMSEMYTMQRYLQYDALVEKNLTHFDSWASIFGETVTSIELAPEGTGYRARTRFSRFHNLPELMMLFKEVADIQTADMLKLPVPEAHYENIIVEPSELQQEMVQELSERAAAVHSRLVDPSEDNMLKITTDGRKIGLDQRLMNPLLPDFEGSKVNACADKVFDIWDDTRADRLTQLVFCDFSTPNKDGRFNIYDDIRQKLLARGIPESEVVFIHDATTETKKKELFAKVRQGKVRILFGSTFKMGAGTNVRVTRF